VQAQPADIETLWPEWGERLVAGMGRSALDLTPDICRLLLCNDQLTLLGAMDDEDETATIHGWALCQTHIGPMRNIAVVLSATGEWIGEWLPSLLDWAREQRCSVIRAEATSAGTERLWMRLGFARAAAVLELEVDDGR
jgi:hypothetical protein